MKYTVRMMNTLLLALPVKGFLWFLLIFALCFVGVHVLQLARVGWEYKKEKIKKPPAEPPKEEKKAPAVQEPVYYIVERKTRRAKSAYTEPKRIQFKGD